MTHKELKVYYDILFWFVNTYKISSEELLRKRKCKKSVNLLKSFFFYKLKMEKIPINTISKYTTYDRGGIYDHIKIFENLIETNQLHDYITILEK